MKNLVKSNLFESTYIYYKRYIKNFINTFYAFFTLLMHFPEKVYWEWKIGRGFYSIFSCLRSVSDGMISTSWAKLTRKYFWNIGRKNFRSVNPYTWICWEINFCNLNPILSKSDLEKIRFKLLNENLSNVICF